MVWLAEPGVRDAILVTVAPSGAAPLVLRFDAILPPILIATAVLSSSSPGRKPRNPSATFCDGGCSRLPSCGRLRVSRCRLSLRCFAGKMLGLVLARALALAGAVAVARRPTSVLGITTRSWRLLTCAVVLSGARLAGPPQPGGSPVRELEPSAEVGERPIRRNRMPSAGVAYGFAVSAHDGSQALEIVDHARPGRAAAPTRGRCPSASPPTRAPSSPPPTPGARPGPPLGHDDLPDHRDPARHRRSPVADCVRGMDFEAPTEQSGALRSIASGVRSVLHGVGEPPRLPSMSGRRASNHRRSRAATAPGAARGARGGCRPVGERAPSPYRGLTSNPARRRSAGCASRRRKQPMRTRPGLTARRPRHRHDAPSRRG